MSSYSFFLVAVGLGWVADEQRPFTIVDGLVFVALSITIPPYPALRSTLGPPLFLDVAYSDYISSQTLVTDPTNANIVATNSLVPTFYRGMSTSAMLERNR